MKNTAANVCSFEGEIWRQYFYLGKKATPVIYEQQ